MTRQADPYLSGVGIGLVLLAAYALRLGRERLLRIANFWFVGIVAWNLVVIHAITAG